MAYLVISLVALLASGLTFFSGFGLGTLLLPAFALLGCAASANYIPLLSVASLFGARKGLALSLLSGAFDAGSSVFLLMRASYEGGTPLRVLMQVQLGGPIAFMLLLFG
jgi:hypothetical protein